MSRDEKPVLEALCDRVLELVGGRAEAEVTASAGRSALTRFANSHIHQNVATDHVGVRLRLASEGRVAGASTDRTDAEGLARLVEHTFEAARLRPPDERWPGLAPPAPTELAAHYDAATHRAPPGRRAEVVRAFVGAGAGLSAAGYCSSGGHEVVFANSAGQRAAGRATHATVDGIHRGPSGPLSGDPGPSGPLSGDPGPSGAAGTMADGCGWQSSVRLDDLDGGRAG